MTFEIVLVLALLGAAMVVFALDRWPIDFVAFTVMSVVLLLGPVLHLSPADAVSGFSNPATITVLAMFILSGGVYRTGAINRLARKIIPIAGEGYLRQMAVIVLVAGPMSAFVNNTAVVAILIPVVMTLARRHERAPSQLLIPLSFGAQLAGSTTLVGTSSSILASSLATESGLPPFGMFEFSAIGLMVMTIGLAYLFTVGRILLPIRRLDVDIPAAFRVHRYVTEVLVLPGSSSAGQTLVESRLSQEFDIDVLEIRRGDQTIQAVVPHTRLEVGDVLMIRARRDRLLELRETEGIGFEYESTRSEPPDTIDRLQLMEVVIGPDSALIGGTLESTSFRNRYNCTVIAIQHRGELIGERLGQVRLHFGDSLLLQGERLALDAIKGRHGFIVTEEPEESAFRPEKIPVALAIVAGVVLVAAAGILPILVTSMVGCVLMVLTGCLRPEELHSEIRWDVIFLLAGVIPLGLAIQSTGAADLLASTAAGVADGQHPLVILVIFYIAAMVMTEVISNNATIVVMAPVAIATAGALGIDPRAVLLAIMFAGSTSFSTPVGYQTNTMIFGPGGYRFSDFIRVGLPLNLLLALLTPVIIYWLWGL